MTQHLDLVIIADYLAAIHSKAIAMVTFLEIISL